MSNNLSDTEICNFVLKNLKINNKWIYQVENNLFEGEVSLYHGVTFSSDFLSSFQRWLGALKLEISSYPGYVCIKWIYRNEDY
jgi:hypothetical protein